MMNRLILLPVVVALGGCVSFGAKPPASLITLTSAQAIAADTARSAGAGDAITILTPLAPQAIANTRVAVADGATAIAYIKDAQWVEPPARLFQRLLSETVAAKTGKVVLDPRQFALAPGTQLSGALKSFGIDARAREAVVIYDAALSTDKGRTVQTRRFEARVPVGEVDAAEAGRALNRAANSVADAVANWLPK
jgi:cholesterol transport system auxiliary component